MSAESADTTFANDSVVASDAAAQSPDAAAAAEADALSAGREDVEPTIFSVVVHTPHNSTIRLNHVNSADTVMSMKQLLSEVPEVCFYTCFTLTIRNETGDDTPLNDYVELEEYPEVREGAEITMRIQKYTVREGRLHIRRLRSILKSPPVPPSPRSGPAPVPAAVDTAEGSTARETAEQTVADPVGESVDSEVDPAVSDAAGDDKTKPEPSKLPMMELPVPVVLEDFYPAPPVWSVSASQDQLDAEAAPLPRCLSSICFSGFNPAPTQRRLRVTCSTWKLKP